MIDDETRTLMEYQEKFGDLPASRRMSEDVLANLTELCRDALCRGKKLTRRELGLSGETPSDAMS